MLLVGSGLSATTSSTTTQLWAPTAGLHTVPALLGPAHYRRRLLPGGPGARYRFFLYTQKTGVPVYVPLPSFVIAALDACPRKSDRHWFWSGVGSKETLAGNWRRTFRRLCEIAGVKGGHPLLDGVKIERVAALLGHSSIKVTERHYNPWVQARQIQLEADLVAAWRSDPVLGARQE
jgi:integrase